MALASTGTDSLESTRTISVSLAHAIDSSLEELLNGEIDTFKRLGSIKDLQLTLQNVAQNLESAKSYLSPFPSDTHKIECSKSTTSSLYELWVRITLYHLEIASLDILSAIDFIPNALIYWKRMRRNRLNAKLQENPIHWLRYVYSSKKFQPNAIDIMSCVSSRRIPIQAKQQALSVTFDNFLVCGLSVTWQSMDVDDRCK